MFDLDAVLNEDNPEPFQFTFAGETYEIPVDDIDIRILAIAETGRFDTAMEYLLGPDMWGRITASDQKVGMKRCMALFEAYAQHVQGVSMGESSGSTGSSVSTVGPSKRTSPSSTKNVSRISDHAG